MRAIETTASFNDKGELKIDKLPNIKNQKVKLLILMEENEDIEWHQFSASSLSAAYGDSEPHYSLSMVEEPNPDYKK
ncbi:hypothetical protein [Mongoliibacter sp.]|uniref:hypothetical protein n=1 Tax=Mongoliibacter sp. TaxID=2022438 RepID=UPI0025F1D9BC|nr:hypothetical protein [Mongoliibacter sp.]